jgi:hypothetical protein
MRSPLVCCISLGSVALVYFPRGTKAASVSGAASAPVRQCDGSPIIGTGGLADWRKPL